MRRRALLLARLMDRGGRRRRRRGSSRLSGGVGSSKRDSTDMLAVEDRGPVSKRQAGRDRTHCRSTWWLRDVAEGDLLHAAAAGRVPRSIWGAAICRMINGRRVTLTRPDVPWREHDVIPTQRRST